MDPFFPPALQAHARRMAACALPALFAAEPNRFARFSVSCHDLLLDYSKNRLTEETLALLIDWAHAAGLEQARADLFSGVRCNWTEQRAVLHPALRHLGGQAVYLDGVDVMPGVRQQLARVEQFATQFRAGEIRAADGRPLRHLVNIGIGGSHLGPEMISQALQPYGQDGPEVRFVSNMDGADFLGAVQGLQAAETLFVLASKTFSTRETLLNTEAALRWLREGGVGVSALPHHLVAVTAAPQRAQAYGITPDRIFTIWDWVGGRYSWCSAIGLSIAVRIGYGHFAQMLAGAHAMDCHFQSAPLPVNMPVVLALLGLWSRLLEGADTLAILPYDHALRRFPAYLQQCDMESNGKRIDRDGQVVGYGTGPVLWGEVGSNAQHSFFQLLHQGTHAVAIDFIACANGHTSLHDHHQELLANFLAQSEVLMRGRSPAEVEADLRADGLSAEEILRLLPHRVFPGNRPSNTVLMPCLTPFNLGMLIALYEMKIFVQGVMWRVNSFDQWGVELGKKAAQRLLQESRRLLAGEVVDLGHHDSSTQGLLRQVIAWQKDQSKN
ncbi:MAG: glucose-6-phosphate isomerase [Magnetococcales bacterium]|nr:glucose-6-phosphate isomerase [Magnetococcales bacterium]MBF0113673.1 glucose-6-phosphate isomerase [Magnetococcales bacterium]